MLSIPLRRGCRGCPRLSRSMCTDALRAPGAPRPAPRSASGPSAPPPASGRSRRVQEMLQQARIAPPGSPMPSRSCCSRTSGPPPRPLCPRTFEHCQNGVYGGLVMRWPAVLVDLDAIVEVDALDHLAELAEAAQSSPGLLGAHAHRVDHREHRPARDASPSPASSDGGWWRNPTRSRSSCAGASRGGGEVLERQQGPRDHAPGRRSPSGTCPG